jgi:hypothetical protein
VQGEEEVLDAVHANPLISLARSHMEQAFLRMQSGIRCTKVVVSFHIHLVQRLQPGDNNFISSSVSGLYTKLQRNLTFSASNMDLCNNIHKEWSKNSSQPTWMGTGQSSCYNLHFNKDLASTFGPELQTYLKVKNEY